MVGDEKPIEEPQYLSGGHSAAPDSGEKVYLKFSRMFESRYINDPTEHESMVNKLIELGEFMTNQPDPPESIQPADDASGDSCIPSGYTYLGQFLAHEITFHKTTELPLDNQKLPENARSPQIDLDCLYGAGPKDATDSRLFEPDQARLKFGFTQGVAGTDWDYPNDLRRVKNETAKRMEALIGDPRNEENLPLAQTHLAFIKFHNKVVDLLEARGCPPWDLFERARKLVVQHFQWIILEDYLPRILDASVLKCVRSRPLMYFKGDEATMPIEFSAAAFRIGHSMVRGSYHWNVRHSPVSPGNSQARLIDLFKFTNFSGDHDQKRLPSDWIIDWRHFYDFDNLHHVPFMDGQYRNKARKIDTIFHWKLQDVEGYPHEGVKKHLRAITVRNLLRGFSFGLPSGEEVAGWLRESPLPPDEVRKGPHEEILSDPSFHGRTPLWYYILKEAELLNKGNRLGPVGSRIIAETFIGLIKKSKHSILHNPWWQPIFGRPELESDNVRFEMADLINFADVADPIGKHVSMVQGK